MSNFPKSFARVSRLTVKIFASVRRFNQKKIRDDRIADDGEKLQSHK